jgi:hypothetical protein
LPWTHDTKPTLDVNLCGECFIEYLQEGKLIDKTKYDDACFQWLRKPTARVSPISSHLREPKVADVAKLNNRAIFQFSYGWLAQSYRCVRQPILPTLSSRQRTVSTMRQCSDQYRR